MCVGFGVMLFLSQFNRSQTFLNNPKHETSLKVYPMGVAVFHADKRRADMTRLIVVFRDFLAKAKARQTSVLPAESETSLRHTSVLWALS